MSLPVRIVTPPAEGVWRVARGNEPLSAGDSVAMDLGDSQAGNRFDSWTGRYAVLYFGTSLEVCFGETLNRFRRDPAMAFIEDEWAELGFMNLGSVPADWRHTRIALKAEIGTTGRFLDVEDAESREYLAQLTASVLAMWGVKELDVPTIRGGDRRVTRLISEVVWQLEDQHGAPAFDGVRYLSRSDTDWECWAVFDRTDIAEVERHPILKTNPALQYIADRYKLTVH